MARTAARAISNRDFTTFSSAREIDDLPREQPAVWHTQNRTNRAKIPIGRLPSPQSPSSRIEMGPAKASPLWAVDVVAQLGNLRLLLYGGNKRHIRCQIFANVMRNDIDRDPAGPTPLTTARTGAKIMARPAARAQF
jgi:hypothetical protein